MRFMLLVKADANTERGVFPSKELIADMGRFNEEMMKAGVLLAGEGLQPSSKGARVKFLDGQRSVVEGPFPDATALIAGFWLIDVRSKEEAIAWAKRSPNPLGEGQPAEIEVRQIFEPSDFPADLFPPEELARELALREALHPQHPPH